MIDTGSMGEILLKDAQGGKEEVSSTPGVVCASESPECMRQTERLSMIAGICSHDVLSSILPCGK